jgi:type II secretory pathway component PulF
MAWFVGPVLVGVMGVLVGLITAALFAPVIKLVVALS